MSTEQYELGTRLKALAALGVNFPADFEPIRSAPFPQAETMLEQLKVRVKKSYKKLCSEYHPDRNGGDSSKTEWFKVLTYVQSEFDRIRVQPPQRFPSMVILRPVVVNSSSSTTTVTFMWTGR